MHGESKWPVSTPLHPRARRHQVGKSWKKTGKIAACTFIVPIVFSIAWSWYAAKASSKRVAGSSRSHKNARPAPKR